MKPVQISKAKALAIELGADGVAIFVFSGDVVAATSYGASKAQCRDMAQWIDEIVDGLGDGRIMQPFEADCPWPAIKQDD